METGDISDIQYIQPPSLEPQWSSSEWRRTRVSLAGARTRTRWRRSRSLASRYSALLRHQAGRVFPRPRGLFSESPTAQSQRRSHATWGPIRKKLDRRAPAQKNDGFDRHCGRWTSRCHRHASTFPRCRESRGAGGSWFYFRIIYCVCSEVKVIRKSNRKTVECTAFSPPYTPHPPAVHSNPGRVGTRQTGRGRGQFSPICEIPSPSSGSFQCQRRRSRTPSPEKPPRAERSSRATLSEVCGDGGVQEWESSNR